MRLTPYNFILEKRIQKGSTIELPYPPDKGEGSFFGAFHHTLSVEGNFFRAPNDFIINLKSDKFEFHWLSNVALSAGLMANLMLEELGLDGYLDTKTGITLRNTVPAPLFMINLKNPKPADGEYLMPATVIKSSGILPVKAQNLDASRTITITSSADCSNRVFRLEGEDQYQRTMIEELQGANAGVVESRKAFHRLNQVTVSGECNGTVSIGTGAKFGLPVFMPSAGFVLKAMLGGAEVKDYEITAGYAGMPTAGSEDRRGLLILPPHSQPDGNKVIYLLVALPNVSNIGSPDFAG